MAQADEVGFSFALVRPSDDPPGMSHGGFLAGAIKSNWEGRGKLEWTRLAKGQWIRAMRRGSLEPWRVLQAQEREDVREYA